MVVELIQEVDFLSLVGNALMVVVLNAHILVVVVVVVLTAHILVVVAVYKYDNLAQEPQLNPLVEVQYVEWEVGSI